MLPVIATLLLLVPLFAGGVIFTEFGSVSVKEYGVPSGEAGPGTVQGPLLQTAVNVATGFVKFTRTPPMVDPAVTEPLSVAENVAGLPLVTFGLVNVTLNVKGSPA